MTTLIRKGMLVLPSGVMEGDILAEEGRIRRIAPHMEAAADTVLEAELCVPRLYRYPYPF